MLQPISCRDETTPRSSGCATLTRLSFRLSDLQLKIDHRDFKVPPHAPTQLLLHR
jgi:hypothetical protein